MTEGRGADKRKRVAALASAARFRALRMNRQRLLTHFEGLIPLAARWAAKGWPARVDDTGEALTAEFSAPSAGPPWFVYRLTPHTATALGAVEPGGATRWRF